MSATIDRVDARSPLRRLPQFIQAVVARPSDEVDSRLRDLLSYDAQWSLLRRLAAFDRAHHLRVYEILAERGHVDADLLRAALLHDVGKADQRGRVRTIHRVAVVLLRRACPGILARLDRTDLPGPLHGIYLALHHAALGAVLAGRAGASARTCDLIARHGSHHANGDAELAALIAADERAIA